MSAMKLYFYMFDVQVFKGLVVSRWAYPTYILETK